MDQEVARKLSNDWHSLARLHGGDAAYDHVYHALLTVLPEDVTATGAVLVDDVPTALALAGSGVFMVTAELVEGGQPKLHLRRRPLLPDRITVSLVEDVHGKLDDGAVGAHLRRWSFRWDDAEELVIASQVKVYNGWDDRPDGGEVFAQALAGAVGWQVPAKDGGR